jgi:hypothetical protein
MSFVPMNFRKPSCPIEETDRCNAFDFSPTAFAKPLFQRRQLTDVFANRNRFDVGDFTNDCEIGRWHK